MISLNQPQPKTRNLKIQKWWFLFCVVGILATLTWFNYLSPHPQNIRIINPDLSTQENAHTTVSTRNLEGLFWISFTTQPRMMALNSLRLRTMGCLNSLSTNSDEWNLPSADSSRCDNQKGLLLRKTASILKHESTWYIAGSTTGHNYGVTFEKNWNELPLQVGLIFLMVFLGGALYFNLPNTADSKESILIIFVLVAAFLLRFWFAFILSPPELTLYSDMAGYFNRGWEIDHGIFNLHQIFQPIGYTLWSLALRKLAGFELITWMQVFASWGVVILIFLMTNYRLGKAAGLFSLVIASFHISQAGFAAVHLAENVYTFLITLSLWSLLRCLENENKKDFVLLGFLLSLSFYFKGNHALFIPCLVLWLFYKNRQQLSKGLGQVVSIALGALIVVMPHLFWTNLHYGKAYLGPTAGALNFVEGKCPSKDNEDSVGSRWMSPLFTSTGEHTYKKWSRPFSDQAYFWKEGLNCIAENPWVLISSVRYIYYLFLGNDPWPLTQTPIYSWYHPWRYFFVFVMLPLSVLGIIANRKKQDFDQATIIMMLSLFLMVWLFKSENRFRVPFDAILVFWSSAGAAWLFEKRRFILHQGQILLRHIY